MASFFCVLSLLAFVRPITGFPVADEPVGSLTNVPAPFEHAPESPDLALATRGYEEHVTLANCKNVNGTQIGYQHSEVAYFVRSPIPDPKGKDLVPVSDGSFLDWTANTIRAPFGTSITFTAKLTDVDEGELAGMGNNGYPDDFYCYRWTRDNFYSFADYECSILYDCSHRNQTIPSKPNSNLDRDQVIAVAVGLGVGVPSLIIAVLTLVYTMRHSSSKSANPKEDKAPPSSRTSSTSAAPSAPPQPQPSEKEKNPVTITQSSITPSSTWSGYETPSRESTWHSKSEN